MASQSDDKQNHNERDSREQMKFIIPFLLLAHSWYPEECCQSEHCYQVTWIKDSQEGTTVKTDDGLVVTVPKTFPRRSSPDGEYHLCFRKGFYRLYHELQMFCFYVPGEA